MTRAQPNPNKDASPAGETVEAAPAARLAGKRLGPYRIESAIGRGGMGVVYKAHDTTLDRPVAIKVLPPHLAEDKDFVKRFVREARACARLNHSGIVQIYQAGRVGTENDPGPCFIAMEYVDAEPLSSRIARKGPMDPRRALAIAEEVAEALAVAHEAGVVHRDIKSGNVLVDARGRAKILDFGLASLADAGHRITRTGAYVGTPEYSSPEQCELGEVDARSDLYSLGVVLYEMLTGEVPFSAPTPLALFNRIVHEPPPPLASKRPDLPRAVERLVSRLLEKRPARRVQSAHSLVTEIRRARAAMGAAGTGTRRALAVRRRRRASRAARMIATAFVLVAAGAAGAFLALSGNGAAPPEADPDPAHAVTEPVPAGPVRVAVLDFEDGTGGGELAWYRVGLAEMVITDLAQNGRLEVLPRERVRAVPAAGPLEAGRALGARLVVHGRYTRVGGQVRLDLKVLDVPNASIVAPGTVTGSADEIFALVDKVTKEVTAALEAKGFLPRAPEERRGVPARAPAKGGGAAADRPVAEVLLNAPAPAAGRARAGRRNALARQSDAEGADKPSRDAAASPPAPLASEQLALREAPEEKSDEPEAPAGGGRGAIEAADDGSAASTGQDRGRLGYGAAQAPTRAKAESARMSPKERLLRAVRERTLGQMLLEQEGAVGARRALAKRALTHLRRARELAPRLERVDALIERAEQAAE